jgi:hypothetical protein
MEQNKALLKTISGWEYWQAGSEVYRVKVGNWDHLLPCGIPMNARWECGLAHFKRFEPMGVFDFVQDQL